MNAFSSRLRGDRPDLDGHRGATLHADLPSTSSPRSAATSAQSCCAPRARPTCCPTSAARVAGRAGGRDGGRRADHARLQQLPRADRRRARDAGRARRAGPLRHRPHRLAPAQRHDRPAPRARARAGRVDGHRGRDRLHHRPPGQPRHASARSSGPGDTVVVDSGDHASILDGCILSRAKLRPFRHNRLGQARAQRSSAPPATAAASWSSSTASSRWRATSPRCRRSPTCARATARG